MVIDVHAHYIPREISHGIYSDLFNMETRDHECFMIVGGHEIELADKGLVDSEKLLKDMDQAGIDMCFISPPPFCFYYEHSKCPDWTRAFNSSMSEDLSKNAPRFRYLATLPLCDMVSTLEELDTVLQDPLCAGVEIATNVAGIELDDMSLHPFWPTRRSSPGRRRTTRCARLRRTENIRNARRSCPAGSIGCILRPAMAEVMTVYGTRAARGTAIRRQN